MKAIYPFGVILAIAILVKDSTQLQCYECSSALSPNCGESFKTDGITVRDCGTTGLDTNTACGKSVIKTSSGTSISRGCTSTCNTVTCTGSNSYVLSGYYCTSDKCNSGEFIKYKMSALLLGVLSSLITFKLLF